MKALYQIIGIRVFFIGIIFCLSLLFAFTIMLLWNWLIPSIFGLTKIGFWQSFGLNLLSGFLIRNANFNNKK